LNFFCSCLAFRKYFDILNSFKVYLFFFRHLDVITQTEELMRKYCMAGMITKRLKHLTHRH
jgi:hypothetical protein